MKVLWDLLFPPICLGCESLGVRTQLCETCWEASSLIDLGERCLHCFTPSERKLCFQCAKSPKLLYPRAALFEREAPILQLAREEAAEAMASFAYYQMERLAWLDTDIIAPVVPTAVAKELARLCSKPHLDLFRRRYVFRGTEKWELREGLIPEDTSLILYDPGVSFRELECACLAISESFPKKVRILSLFL